MSESQTDHERGRLEHLTRILRRRSQGLVLLRRHREQRDEGEALQAVAAMQQGLVVDLDPILALSAARLSLAHRLPLADSVILATARAFGATLWTQDSDFEGMDGVRFRPAPR